MKKVYMNKHLGKIVARDGTSNNLDHKEHIQKV
jgi:hypothetical protein